MPVWAKFGLFWAQNPIFWAQGVKILVPSYWDSNETPFSCWKHWSVDKFGYLGPKVNFLFNDRDFCWCSKWPLYPGLQLSHRNHPQKIFRFRARGHFLGLTPVFGRFLAIPTLEGQLSLILVRFQRNSGEPSGSSKKWPRRTTDPVRAGITEKRAFLRSAEKWFLA